MPRLALSDDFVADLVSLQRPVQKEVSDAIQMFRSLSVPQLHASKGLHLEKLERARDKRIRTIRITRSYRAVLLAPDDGSDLFTLLRVATHDDAINWARKRAYSVNGATGGLEVRNVEALEQMETYFESKTVATPTRLFGRHSDTALRDLGIDDQVLRLARVCVTADDLTVMAPPMMPADQYEVLEYLAADYSVQDVWEQLIAPRGQTVRTAEERPAITLTEAILNSPDRIVEVTGPDELERILTEDLVRWRIFLHPAQKRYAYHPGFNGPAQVTGGPGTGKTVVALHRVRHLLRTGRESDRLLLTTFTNAMAAALRDSLALLLGEADAHLLKRVDVTTVDSLAARVIREARGSAPKPLSNPAEKSAWTRASAREDLPWTEQFLSQEFRNVVLAQGLRTPEEYLRCVRRGRGTQVGRVQRARLWRVMERFATDLSSRDSATYTQLCDQAARCLADSGPRYRHVIVDEAQDLHPAQWRVLRACVAPQPDDIFLVGDPHQRVYDSRVSLRSLGVHVRGRTSRLRLNYRSTEEILRWSASLLDGQPVGRLGEDDDDDAGRDSLQGYRSQLHGRVPAARGYDSQDEELKALTEQVRMWIDQDGVKPSEVAVCARFNTLVDAVISRLRREGIPAVAVKDDPGPEVSGVRVATMHAMKGLEFRCVGVVGVTSKVLPFTQQVTPVEVDPVQHQSDLMAEHCLLFVACTRARDALSVSWSGQRSPMLDPVTG
ncbi:UvrD-helicase domain-containing protein [Streptomyces cyaneofuscatus]|uniref:DNA 3'-5' helicase n=1 Tax=Streptomyces cyaneofuscatus TaxID=66883 RepID=A0ABZ1ERR6_9ACTN|nr:UvrD-helicase domain-containing protein [Streptomyces cyaneofuscatus]WSB06815.1 UvrD-helicase domain-containing protein [Streptomyces cyaneofuscatus]WSD49650.1 UvrD-helicase domain-containing protein [Streptomyces cyaneofuscatus]